MRRACAPGCVWGAGGVAGRSLQDQAHKKDKGLGSCFADGRTPRGALHWKSLCLGALQPGLRIMGCTCRASRRFQNAFETKEVATKLRLLGFKEDDCQAHICKFRGLLARIVAQVRGKAQVEPLLTSPPVQCSTRCCSKSGLKAPGMAR